MSEVAPTSSRKADHIRINLEEDVQSGLSNGLERYRFLHQALPELSLEQVTTRARFLGHALEAPLLISSMTGGTEKARRINRTLAEAAQALGIAMGLGSQRAALEDSALQDTFQVRDLAPDVFLLANLGAVQLNYGCGPDECRRAVEMVNANALVLHLNPLQEALQPEGDSDFSNLLSRIEAVCRSLLVPVIVKEVGWGISAKVALWLANAGVAGIDVAGAGGTSWSQVEMHRARSTQAARLAAAFVNWGIPTAEALRQCHAELPHLPLVASGGIRDGVDVAKCIALGATLVGAARPFLQAASHSVEAVVEAAQLVEQELRIVMFAVGAADIPSLQATPLQAP
ncbi:MAG: type 2 isopentenyl-diphosphate Delta-isomerase [Anaerolineales bacterium]|jgi:isopentenyl-diphosphate delta-isomerase